MAPFYKYYEHFTKITERFQLSRRFFGVYMSFNDSKKAIRLPFPSKKSGCRKHVPGSL